MQVITITSRYVLFNNSSEPLQYGQRNTNLVWQLAPGVKAPFHWDDADGRFELCVRPAQGKWNWSGAFEVGPAFLTPLACVSHTPCLCHVPSILWSEGRNLGFIPYPAPSN